MSARNANERMTPAQVAAIRGKVVFGMGGKRTTLEESFAGFLRLYAPDLAQPVEQFRYVPGRKFTADFAWPDARLLVFCEGGVFGGKAHGSVSGILKDVERSQFAASNGWRVFRVTNKCLKENATGTLERLREAVRAGEVGR